MFTNISIFSTNSIIKNIYNRYLQIYVPSYFFSIFNCNIKICFIYMCMFKSEISSLLLSTELITKPTYPLPSLLECDNAIVHEDECWWAAVEAIKCHNSVTSSPALATDGCVETCDNWPAQVRSQTIQPIWFSSVRVQNHLFVK